MELVAGLFLGGLGALIADCFDGLRLFLKGDGPGATHRWPTDLAFSGYLKATGIRVVLALLVVGALHSLSMLCSPTLAFLAGLATLKVSEVLLGYHRGAEAPER